LRSEQERVSAAAARVEEQVRVGELGTTELKLIQSELARVEANRVRLDGERERALSALEASAGRRALPDDDAMPVPPWPLAAKTDDTLPARIADAQAQAADAQARAQRRALLPSLSASADYYQFEGSGRGQESWAVGGRVSLPLDFGTLMRDRSAQDRARAAREADRAAQIQSRRQWASLQSGYESARAEINALQSEIAAREQVVAVQRALASVGAQSVEQALRDERDLYETQTRLAQVHAQAIEAWSAAQVLLGVAPEAYIASLDAGR
jgi:outer membrane protein TolC